MTIDHAAERKLVLCRLLASTSSSSSCENKTRPSSKARSSASCRVVYGASSVLTASTTRTAPDASIGGERCTAPRRDD